MRHILGKNPWKSDYYESAPNNYTEDKVLDMSLFLKIRSIIPLIFLVVSYYWIILRTIQSLVHLFDPSEFLNKNVA